MYRQMWNIILMTLVAISYVFGAHVYKDYRNNAVVLRPMHSSSRNNFAPDFASSLNQNEMMPKKRIKRSPSGPEHNEYYDAQTSESANDWAVNSQAYPFSDLVCTRRSEAQTHITVSDPHSAGLGPVLNLALLAKYAFFLFVAFWVKAILFKLLIIPFKVLIGLKAISFINSLLLGALLLKSKSKSYFGFPFPLPGTNPGQVTPLSGTIPFQQGVAPASPAAAASAASASSDDQFNDDYVDVVRPGEDLKRILDYVKKRNENW